MSDETRSRYRFRLRKWPLIIGCVFVAAAGVWKVAEYVLDVNQHRRRVVEIIQKRTGLPAEIGELDLRLLPWPSLKVNDIVVGEGEFKAECTSVAVHPNFGKLLTGNIEASSVQAAGVKITVPKETPILRERIAAVQAKLAEPQPDSGFKISIQEVSASKARVFLAGSEVPFATFDVDAGDVLGTHIPVSIISSLSLFGADARIKGDVVVDTNDAGQRGISGQVEVTNGSLSGLTADPNAGLVRFNALGTIKAPTLASIECDITGETTPAADAPAYAKSLAGTIKAKAWLKEGGIYINDFVWDSDDLDLRADVTRHPDGVLACNVIEAHLKRGGVAELASYARNDRFVVDAKEGATADATDLVFGLDAAGEPKLSQGLVTFSGLDLVTVDGKLVESGLRGALELKDGQLHVKELKGASTSFKGTISPDLAKKVVAIDLSGNASISREKLAVIAPLDAIEELKGEISITRLAGTFGGGSGLPADLVMEGALDKGFVKFRTEAVQDVFSPVTASFTTSTDGIVTDAKIEGAKLGPMACNGRFDFARRQWAGHATLDVARVVMPFLKTEETRTRLQPVLESYGTSTFAATAQLPVSDTDGAVVKVTRDGTPALTATVALLPKDKRWIPGDISASGQVEMASFAALMGSQASVSGLAPIQFSRLLRDQSLVLSADLTPCRITAGQLIEKSSGVAASVEIHGPATEELWGAESFSANVLGQTIEGKLVGDRVQVPSIKLDLSPLSPVLAQGGSMSGQLTGAFSTNPSEFSLALAHVAIAVSDALAIDSIDGTIEYGGGSLILDNVRMRGANSDCTVDMRDQGGTWKGGLKGPKVDANALLALAGTASAFTATSTATKGAVAEPVSKPLRAEFAVAADMLYYKRAQFSAVHADVTMDGPSVQVRNLTLVPYSGAITGQADITLPKDSNPVYVDAALKLDAIDARVLDEVSPLEPRGFKGALSGTVNFRGPIPATGSPLATGSGEIQLTGNKGSLGKMGMATKLLAALRTTELLTLHLPSMEDGLTYDTLNAELNMVKGQMAVNAFTLENRSMNIVAGGNIDWAADNANMKIIVYPLEGITSLIEIVPVVGNAAKDRFGLKFDVTGPVTSPDVKLAAGQDLRRLKVDVKSGKEIVEGVKGKTVDKAVEKIGNAIGNILGK
jgi:hypothetical protein